MGFWKTTLAVCVGMIMAWMAIGAVQFLLRLLAFFMMGS